MFLVSVISLNFRVGSKDYYCLLQLSQGDGCVLMESHSSTEPALKRCNWGQPSALAVPRATLGKKEGTWFPWESDDVRPAWMWLTVSKSATSIHPLPTDQTCHSGKGFLQNHAGPWVKSWSQYPSVFITMREIRAGRVPQGVQNFLLPFLKRVTPTSSLQW